MRTCRYEGGAYKYWLRRRVMQSASTLGASSLAFQRPTSQDAMVFAADAALDGWYQLA